MIRKIIIDYARSTISHSAIYDCCIECEECPFRYRCYTQAEIMRVTEGEYRDACTVVPGYRYISLIKMGKVYEDRLLRRGMEIKNETV